MLVIMSTENLSNDTIPKTSKYMLTIKFYIIVYQDFNLYELTSWIWWVENNSYFVFLQLQVCFLAYMGSIDKVVKENKNTKMHRYCLYNHAWLFDLTYLL